jgi:hypothetical protein
MSLTTFWTTALVAAAALSSVANAHIKIQSPTPFGVDTLDTSPLLNFAPGASGSDFPCKQRTGVYDISERTEIAAGSQSPLVFSGSASHGGGVCELLLTTDLEPTANTEWKLFTVIEGCPLKGDASSGGVSDYSFTIPEGMPNGNATFAWVWYNRIGNREIYMNCAPISISSGSDDKTAYNALNNAYFINLPRESCSSQEMGDTIIPNPGKADIQKFSPTSQLSASGSACAAAAAAMTQGGSGGSGSSPASGAASATATAASASSPAGYSGSASSSSSSNSPDSVTSAAAASIGTPAGGEVGSSAYGGAPSSFVTMTSAAAPSAYPTMAATSASAAAPTSYVPASGTNSSSTSSSDGSGDGGAASSGSSNGGMTCSSNGSQFCVEAEGQNVCRPVAPGTTCQNGAIMRKRSPGIRRRI